MTVVEDVVSCVKDAAAAAGRKTGEWVELGKLKLKIVELRREIAAAHEGLGRLVYDSRTSGESVDDMVDACVEHLGELYDDLEELEMQMMQMKSVVRCNECGMFNENHAVFCNQCGTRID